jgi:hypothetical protein
MRTSQQRGEIAAEFVRLKVNVILAGGNEAALAAKQATAATFFGDSPSNVDDFGSAVQGDGRLQYGEYGEQILTHCQPYRVNTQRQQGL